MDSSWIGNGHNLQKGTSLTIKTMLYIAYFQNQGQAANTNDSKVHNYKYCPHTFSENL